MKKTSIYVLFCFVLLQLEGCSKTEDGSYVAPITIYEKINGMWSLDKLTYVDEIAKANDLSLIEEDLSSWFNYSDFLLQLNVDDENQPTTYEVTGDVPPLFSPTGYWSLTSDFVNSDLTAVRINLFDDASKQEMTDQLRIIAVPGSSQEMQIQLVRTSNDVAFASYLFKLSKAN
ncbi:DUF5004 domain-containing protein [Geofilum sp. OHC36d9]|uniref:DUF5004 domain-containing protein n=1 Tax=Geofilum sp. OHC36d9 TaxID=3458413 RepID=UPI0040337B7A